MRPGIAAHERVCERVSVFERRERFVEAGDLAADVAHPGVLHRLVCAVSWRQVGAACAILQILVVVVGVVAIVVGARRALRTRWRLEARLEFVQFADSRGQAVEPLGSIWAIEAFSLPSSSTTCARSASFDEFGLAEIAAAAAAALRSAQWMPMTAPAVSAAADVATAAVMAMTSADRRVTKRTGPWLRWRRVPDVKRARSCMAESEACDTDPPRRGRSYARGEMSGAGALELADTRNRLVRGRSVWLMVKFWSGRLCLFSSHKPLGIFRKGPVHIHFPHSAGPAASAHN